MEIARRLYDIARATVLGDQHQGGEYQPKQVDPGQADESAAAEADSAKETRSGGAVDPKLAALYANLEVPYGSDLSAVRAAWRRLLKQYHPDLHGVDPTKREVANELTARLTAAYEELETALTQKETS